MPASTDDICIFWFRRDLRLNDNHGLYQALRSGYKVLPLFIFDRSILDSLSDRHDRRVQFIHEQITELRSELVKHGSDLHCIYSTPLEAFRELVAQFHPRMVVCNEDYEPSAIARDIEVEHLLRLHGVAMQRVKDQVIFSGSEVLKDDQTPYTVFTPYSRKWKSALMNSGIENYESENELHQLYQCEFQSPPTLEVMDFVPLKQPFPLRNTRDAEILHYDETRNIPSLDSTTHLGIHLRFGTVSIRKLVQRALNLSEVWLNELIWREFFMMILANYPQVVTRCFKPKYEAIKWRNNEEEFEAWCNGQTGYPIVDAGMHELTATGFMHNRVRMIVASFLCKHLLIDWRWGEAFFAQHLLDYELSANNGNWQWSAGCGCDAAPYFRIFNPAEQTRKFDPKLLYINRWLGADDLLRTPIVEHRFARERALQCYRAALGTMDE